MATANKKLLNPQSDRLDYSKLLTPPFGFETEFAVGTTYSLDLNSLIGVTMALGASDTCDEDSLRNPIRMLNALTLSSKRIAVFCQAGQIFIPQDILPVHGLLDSMVFEIKIKRDKKHHQVFHPKVWIVKFKNGISDLWRVIILSRNLTFDCSWDVAVCLEGKTEKEEDIKNTPLQDFLEYLMEKCMDTAQQGKKKKMLGTMAKEIMYVTFSSGDEKVDFDFLPVGIPSGTSGSYSLDDSGLFSKWDNLFVISPFLGTQENKNPLERLLDAKSGKNMDTYKPILITRRSEVSHLSERVRKSFIIYVLREEAFHSGEEYEEPSNPDGQDIHAKLYLRTYYSKSELYLGSMNASYNAFYAGNIEFMLKLSTTWGKLNTDMLSSALLEGEDSPFELLPEEIPEQIPDSQEETMRELVQCMRELEYSGKVEPIGDDSFDLELKASNLPEGLKGRISPLLYPNIGKDITSRILFSNMKKEQLSEFFCVKLVGENGTKLDRIIRIVLKGIPEDRDAAIVRSVIRDEQDFISYVSLLLGDDYYDVMMEMKRFRRYATASSGNNKPIPALYEKMLKVAAENPNRLEEVEKLLMDLQDHPSVPEGFQQICNSIIKAVKK
jgi:hypothetical protein